MTPSAILKSALYVTDLVTAEAFYADIIGLPVISKVEGRHVFFRCGDGVLLLFNAEATRQPPKAGAKLPVPPHGTSGEGHLCFAASAAEIADWKARLEAKGITIEADFEWPTVDARSIFATRPAIRSNLPNQAFGELHARPIGQEDRRRQPQ